MKSKKVRWTAKALLRKGIPIVLIPGLLAALALGWKGDILEKTSQYTSIKKIFPYTGVVSAVDDGDTFTLKNGVRVRLVGINAPDRGATGYTEAKEYLTRQISQRFVYLEYDRYMDDKYGRVLAWVWMDCEAKPKFLPADYMHKSGNASREGLTENPKGCKKGRLVNEELVSSGFAKAVRYKERGELKYEQRLFAP